MYNEQEKLARVLNHLHAVRASY